MTRKRPFAISPCIRNRTSDARRSARNVDAPPSLTIHMKETVMLKKLLFGLGIGYLFRRMRGGRHMRGATGRW